MSADVRSPFVVDTRELGRRAGHMRELDRTFDLPGRIGTDIISIPQGAPIELHLRLEAVMDGVLASGNVEGTAIGECSRCLDPIEQALQVEFQQLALYPGKAEGLDDDDENVSILEEDLLDTEPLVTDAIVLELPLSPLCSPDCPGLCSQCGFKLEEDPDHSHDDIDPRFASLQQLLADSSDQKEN